MEIHNTPFNLGNSILNSNNSTINGDEQKITNSDPQQTQETKQTNVIMSNLVDLLTEVTGTENPLTPTTNKTDDPTDITNALIAPEDEAILENLDKLIAILQMETSEEQLKMAQERIAMLKDQIEARCADQLKEISESCEKLAEQLKEQEKARALRWLSAILGIFAAIVTCLTMGAAGPAAVALCCVAVAVATVSLIDTICQEFDTSLSELVQKGVEKILKGLGKSTEDAEKIAQGIMTGLAVCAVAAMIACSIASACTGNFAEISKVAITLQGIVSTISGATTIGSAVNSYNIAQTSYDITMAQVELMEIKKILERLEQMMDDEQESVQEITKMLQSNVAVLKNLLESEAKITSDITDNIGNVQA